MWIWRQEQEVKRWEGSLAKTGERDGGTFVVECVRYHIKRKDLL